MTSPESSLSSVGSGLDPEALQSGGDGAIGRRGGPVGVRGRAGARAAALAVRERGAEQLPGPNDGRCGALARQSRRRLRGEAGPLARVLLEAGRWSWAARRWWSGTRDESRRRRAQSASRARATRTGCSTCALCPKLARRRSAGSGERQGKSGRYHGSSSSNADTMLTLPLTGGVSTTPAPASVASALDDL